MDTRQVACYRGTFTQCTHIILKDWNARPWDKVRRCHVFTSIQEGPHQKLFFQENINFVANWIIVDFLK